MRLCFLQPKMFWLSSSSMVLPQSSCNLHYCKYHAVLSLYRPCLLPLQDPVFFEEKSMVLFIPAFLGPSRSPSS